MRFHALPKTSAQFSLHVGAYREALCRAGKAAVENPCLRSCLVSWMRHMKPFHITTNANCVKLHS
jgi:hypothetical protein